MLIVLVKPKIQKIKINQKSKKKNDKFSKRINYLKFYQKNKDVEKKTENKFN